MMYFDSNKGVAILKKPKKLVLPDGSTLMGELSDEVLAEQGFYPVAEDPATTSAQKLGDYVVVDGVAQREVLSKPQEELDEDLQVNLDRLDKSCRRYIDQFSHWSGGIMANEKAKAGKPKAKALSDWTEQVWLEYYARVARLQGGEAFDGSFLDFTTVGPAPHSMAEIMAE